MSDSVMWMVRSDSGNLYEEFHDNHVVAIGWHELLSARPGMTREQMADIYAKERPEFKRGTIISGAAQVWRFLNEMKPHDWVTTYNPSTRQYLVGTVSGPPEPHPELAKEGMSWTRDVAWVGEISRDRLSARTKRALGPTLTVFQIEATAAAEIRAVAQDKENALAVELRATAEDPVGDDAQTTFQEIEAQSIEFIKDRITKLDWDEMQDLVAGILRAMGYKTRVSRPGPDRGADIVASPDGLGFENPRIVVEVKHRHGQMGTKEIRSFLGGRHKDDRGLYVSTGGFSKEARYEGDRASIPITLWELDDIVRSVVDNYEALDADTKQLVPLRRIYWPI